MQIEAAWVCERGTASFCNRSQTSSCASIRITAGGHTKLLGLLSDSMAARQAAVDELLSLIHI
eukprot:11820931-Alexandrium_andersonii.AAC.1